MLSNNKGTELLNRCFKLLWIKGDSMIPFSPFNFKGYMPDLLKLNPNLISNQNTNHKINTKPIGKIRISCVYLNSLDMP